MLDYMTLKLIWWLLIGVLLIGFAIMDGHDMGVGTLLPFVGKNDVERRVVINTVAPHWDGNQVWFITAGGAIFAAWPFVYAIAFSGLYWAMLLLLAALFFRPVGFEYRSKIVSDRWRNNWDWALFFGSSVPALLFGVAFGNLFLGVPFQIDDTMRAFFSGSFFDLLHPFALLVGVVSLTLLMLQGGSYLVHRTEGVIQERVKRINRYSAAVLLSGFSLAGVWLSRMNGMRITELADPNASINPLMKQVEVVAGGWLGNYAAHPVLWVFPALVYVGVLATLWLQRKKHTLSGFVAMSLAVLGMIMTAGVALFPFVMPSSAAPEMSLTLWDAASSHYTLGVMLVVVLIFVPMILIYTSIAYRIMRGKVTTEYVQANDKALY